MDDLIESSNEPDLVLWGAKQIGEAINLTEAQAKYLLENGMLPGKKFGGRWISTRRRVRAKITEGICVT
jgi:hypothetical protein